jgi:ADP-ribose pyrophosphatase YjhB (NUDIX family)
MRQNIAAVLIFRQGDKVAFIKRQNTGWMDGKYALPGGKIDAGESYTQGAIREAAEEVGVIVEPDDMEARLVAHLRGENDDNIWTNVVFEAHIWAGEVHNAEPHAASELVWLNPQDLPPDETVPQTFFYFEQLAAGHHYGEYGWD